jgi:hypothetical protein
MQLVADTRDGVSDEITFFVQDTDFDGASTAALDLPPDSGHEHGDDDGGEGSLV